MDQGREQGQAASPSCGEGTGRAGSRGRSGWGRGGSPGPEGLAGVPACRLVPFACSALQEIQKSVPSLSFFPPLFSIMLFYCL